MNKKGEKEARSGEEALDLGEELLMLLSRDPVGEYMLLRVSSKLESNFLKSLGAPQSELRIKSMPKLSLLSMLIV